MPEEASRILVIYGKQNTKQALIIETTLITTELHVWYHSPLLSTWVNFNPSMGM